jgi:hypothetical protein
MAHTHVTEMETPIEYKGPVDEKLGMAGQWEEVGDDDDYYKKHSIEKLDEATRKEIEKAEIECRARALEEIVI